jgi:hypothetical protein
MIRFLVLLLTFFAVNISLSAQSLNRQSYVAYGESYLSRPWQALSRQSFARFKTDGNRVEYEGQVFERRRHLAALAMAEIIEGNGRFLQQIVVGIDSMLQEPWWGIPAHYDAAVPQYDKQTVDLFNAESAALLAWTCSRLERPLTKIRPTLPAKVSREIHHRMLEPVLGSSYWWKSASMNWNPWICSNWLACLYLYESDENRMQKAVTEIEGCMKKFIDSYPDDGGCDEVTGYWDRAAASYFECLYLLDLIKKEEMANVTMLNYKRDKVARMGAYIYNMYIGNDYVVTFADAHSNKSVVQLNVLFPFADFIGDRKMAGFAAFIAKKNDFWNNPSALYANSGNFPTLGRELLLMQHIDKLQATKAAEPKSQSFYPHLNVAIMRSKGGLFVALKGGNNGESHNHNDLGSFEIFADGQPLFIDCGVGEYTSKTFSKDRYDIWTMQSQYHNCPQVNGINQKDGRKYTADMVMMGYHSHAKEKVGNSYLLNLSKAYPEEAMVEDYMRAVELKGEEVKINDVFTLKKFIEPTRLYFMTTVKPELKKGKIVLGNHSLSYPYKILTAEVEDCSSMLDDILKGMWGENLYRIVLTTKKKEKKREIELIIK